MTTNTENPLIGASEDYSYDMNVSAPIDRIIEALTNDNDISRWWPIFSVHEREGNELRFVMGDMGPLDFTVASDPSTNKVTWSVTQCSVLSDWVGTTPTFVIQPNSDGTSQLSFRHVGLSPEVECFEQCQAGWNQYMPSLYEFLQASPNRSK